MKKGNLIFTMLICLFALSACSQSPDFKLYEGKPLRIAVVGEPPEVKEEQVTFQKISFDELTKEEIGSYDAVIITEENLTQAADSKYANTYLKSTIPSFFLSARSHIPFTVEKTNYDESWKWTAGNYYAVGVFTSQETKTLKNWGYGLYNDKKTDENIKEVYSRIFKTVEELNL